MLKSRKILGALVAGVGSIGLMAACVPEPAPPAPPAEVSDTVVIPGMECHLSAYNDGVLFTEFDFTLAETTLTISALAETTSGDNVDYTIVFEDFVNGPLPLRAGTVNFGVSLDGAPAELSDTQTFGEVDRNLPVTLDGPSVGSLGPVTADANLTVQTFEFFGTNLNNELATALSECTIAEADQPSIDISVS